MAKDSIDNLLSSILNSTSVKEPLVEKPKASAGGFGAKVLAKAQADVGVREDLGKNDGKRIRQYFKYLKSSSGQDWCAAAVSAWMIEAGGGPVSGSLGVLNLMSKFNSAGLLIPKKSLSINDIVPGNLVFWSRGESGSGKGHIGVLESVNGNSFVTIEGNSGPRGDSVVRNSHSLSDGRLLGVGVLNGVKKAGNGRIDDIVKLANYFSKLSSSGANSA